MEEAVKSVVLKGASGLAVAGIVAIVVAAVAAVGVVESPQERPKSRTGAAPTSSAIACGERRMIYISGIVSEATPDDFRRPSK
jgi:hypothetical protein